MELVRGGRIEVPVEELDDLAIGGSASASAVGALRLVPEAPVSCVGPQVMPPAAAHDVREILRSVPGSTSSGSHASPAPRGRRQAKQMAHDVGAAAKARVVRVEGSSPSSRSQQRKERKRGACSRKQAAVADAEIGLEKGVLANDGRFVTASKLRQQLDQLEKEESAPPAMPALPLERQSRMRS